MKRIFWINSVPSYLEDPPATMKVIRKHLELTCWIAALLFPFFIDPYSKQHFTLCLFHLLGIDWCPGCGLGRALAFGYRGEWLLSWQRHWLALPAFLIILYRIFILAFRTINHQQTFIHGPKISYDVTGNTTR